MSTPPALPAPASAGTPASAAAAEAGPLALRVRYFASLREALGAGETVSLPAAGASVGALRAALVARGGRHAEVLQAGRAVRAAVNQTMAGDDAALADGDEVAFFPPVTGG